jgi:signal peptide peptidase SppA
MLLPTIWNIHQNYFQSSIELILNSIKAGPVEDADREGLPINKYGSTAVISTVGPMIKRAGWMARYGIAGTRDAQEALIAAANDEEIESIVWVMDTPGGSVEGLNELAQTVKRVNAIKPITVQVDGLLASAGYYVAANASAIYAARDDLIGSIGVRTVMIDSSKYYEEMGVKVIPVDTGPHKSAGLDGTPVTDQQIAATQEIIDGLYKSFLNEVQEGRGISGKDLETVADGRVFLSDKALTLGLIDGIQTLSETIGAIQTNVRPGRSTRAARVKLAAL